MKDIHYLNADFDLTLRERPLGLGQPSRRKAVDAMTAQGLLMGDAGDAALVRVGIPPGFMEYLRRQEIEEPRLLRHPRTDPGMLLRPFGWNAEAAEINLRQLTPAVHPPLESVRRVNSRAFSSALEREHGGGDDAGETFTSTEDLARWLSAREDSSRGWVVKADHSNAALGNRRLRGRKLNPGERRFIDGLFAEDSRAVVEPWHRRLTDFCAVFTLGPAGEMEGLRLHETVCTSDGALIGAIFHPHGPKGPPGILPMAEAVAGELSRQGYFGPVCFDAFTYRRGGEERLRALADLNCRRPMSDAVHGLWRRRLARRVFYWRFFSTRRLNPRAGEYAAHGVDAFSPSRGRGILLTSPWTVEMEGRWLTAPKISLAFIGEGREEVLAMERAFRSRCEL